MNDVNHFVVYLAFRHGVDTRIWLCYNHLHSFGKTFSLTLCLSYSTMARKSSNYYRSKSLNAQWEDLSCSVSYLLNEHKEPTPKAESLGQIKTGHWVNSSERTHCADGSCRKKFTLTERKHHCRRYVKRWLAGLSSGYYKITRCYPNISNIESNSIDLSCFLYHLRKRLGKISAQPHTTLCIQLLDRENNDKNNKLPSGKQICFKIVWGCAKIIPHTFQIPVGEWQL